MPDQTPRPVPRRTLAAPVRVEGVGVFTGLDTAVRFEPRAADAAPGLTIARDGGEPAPATIENLSHEPVHPIFEAIPSRHTNIATPGGTVFTVEHALAALAGLGITDAHLEVTGPELPFLDGSAIGFAEPIIAAGTAELPGVVGPLAPAEPARLASDDGRAVIDIAPRDAADAPLWRYELDYAGRIPPCTASWDGSPAAFIDTIAPARTFALEEEARAMRDAGLFTRFAPDDLLVMGSGGAPIDNALRAENETAAHKLLDLIGDLALAGAPVAAAIHARRSGHALNHAVARALAARTPR